MGTDLTFLLDTSTLIWATSLPDRLSAVARHVCEHEADVLVSAASAWEIATRHRIGRLDGVDELVHRWDEELARYGYRQLDISHKHALRSGAIDVSHSDPFDRLIAAQAELNDLTLVAKDPAFDLFPVRRLW